MPKKTPWIGTSWKMNKTRAEAREFALALAGSSVAKTIAAKPFVIPPFTAIADVAERLAGTRVAVGAQNMHWAPAGAWTGEISAAMIRDAGASLVEIGHSERRQHFGETNETVALKTKAAIDNGLLALVCVGDTRAEYEAGRTSEVLATQVRFAVSHLSAGDRGRVVIAYEPVWSIGEGGVPADPDFAADQHRRIKDVSMSLFGEPVDVVYGGSVNPDNCVPLATRPNIDGLFIGRSAWRVEGYIGIVEKVAAALAG
ncbi:MAG: triose-phosphate isomerase [Hyphomicrobiales bacterium]|nr:triose-phosphate isomerase [Hyphomicrobiales bacterium]